MKDPNLSYLTILLWLCTGLCALAVLFTAFDHRWITAGAFAIAGALIFLLLRRAIRKSEEEA